jgi:predicted transposase/invertase (TIGR01784 family)
MEKTTIEIKAKLDVIFKILFSKNLDLLHELLSALLGLPMESIRDIVIKNPDLLPEDVGGKFARLDIVMDVDGRTINVEMQCYRDPDYLDRSLFNWAKLFSGGLESGEGYGALKDTICINILSKKLFDCKGYHSRFNVMETTRHEVLSDKLDIHFFELTKIAKTIDKDDRMQLWLQLINAETEEEFDMLTQTGVEPIKKAVYTLYQMSEDERIRELARVREKALHDEATLLATARREGLERGIAEGMEKGIAEGRTESLTEVARNALKMGFKTDEIVRLTGLTREELERLK